jgi:hypothetical protein
MSRGADGSGILGRIAVAAFEERGGFTLFLTLPEPRHRCGEPVTTGGNRLNAASFRSPLIENPP